MENISFENAMQELEKCAKLIKQDDISLEDAIKYYEQGIKLYDQCNEILSSAKQKIEVYSK